MNRPNQVSDDELAAARLRNAIRLGKVAPPDTSQPIPSPKEPRPTLGPRLARVVREAKQLNPDAYNLALFTTRGYKYGLSTDDWLKLVLEHGGKCGICAKPTDDPHIDHCHDTGKVRGLLCRSCNFGLGFFSDSPETLGRAIQYLARNADYRSASNAARTKR